MNLDSELKRSWLVAILALGTVGNAFGQDPFDDADFAPSANAAQDSEEDPFALDSRDPDEESLDDGEFANAASALPVVAPSTERNAVVRSLLAHPPTSPKDLAKAVQLMVRIKRWDEVGRWLKVANNAGITESSAAEMVNHTGAEVFQGIASPLVHIPEEQKAIARRIVDLANAHRQNPQAVARAASALQSKDSKSWQRSFKLLQGSGYLGIEKYFEAVMAPNAPPPSRVMAEALRKLGPSARDAWLEAVKTPHQDARANLIRLAIGSKDVSYTRELLGFLANRETLPNDLQSLADEWIARSKNAGEPSLVDYAGELAESQLVQRLKAYQQIQYENDEATEIRWELDPAGRGLKSSACRPSQVLWQRTVVEAANVARTEGARSKDHALATAVLLQDADGLKSESSVLAWGGEESRDLERYEFACMVWDAASRHDLPTAQARIAGALGRFSLPMPIEVRDRLVQALDSGYRPVRYIAASSLMQSIQQGQAQGIDNGSFLGRGRLDRVIREMTQIKPNRQAILVGGSASLRTHMRSLLEQLGYSCEEFSNARTLIARCKEGAPVDEIYIVHRVLEMEFGELLQRLRGTPSAAKTPIAMLADSLSSRELEFMAADPRVKLGFVPPSLPDLEPMLLSLRLLGQGMELADEARVIWREDAEEFLASLQPKGTAPTRATLVASVPQSPVGQRELVLKAIDKSMGLPEREQASQLFVQSVRQFGMQISSETADGLYDVYNNRAEAEVELRQVLGRILDAIEANRGEKDWDSVRP